MISSNNFNKEQPTKSGSSFAQDVPSSGGTPTSSKPQADDHLFEGENTGGNAYGADFAIFGQMYGSGEFGGYTHFLNRTAPPSITH